MNRLTEAALPVNEHGQVTDDNILKKDRWKFGLGMIISQSEEVGLGGLPTVLIRRMGGNDFHLGFWGAMTGLNSLFQFAGPMLLKWKQSNQGAMRFAMVSGAIITTAIACCILGLTTPISPRYLLFGFLFLSTLLSIMQGVQWNLESSWIGDLVPVKKLGWFTSIKWILATLGIVLSSQLIGRIGDAFPTPGGYAGIYLFFCLSYLIAFFLYGRVTDRKPKNVSFFGKAGDTHGNIGYRCRILWLYVTFYTLWSCGRILMGTFAFAFLMDAFHFNLTDMAWLSTLQFLLSCVSIFIMGKVCARIGHRLPLMLVIAFVSLFQFGYTLSAWWGLTPIIAYTIVNAMAGHGFSMLAINYGLEIFPDKGRSIYLALTRFVIGLFVAILLIFSGKILESVKGIQFHLWGATLGHYHLLFFIATLITFSCVIPLLIIGKRKVEA